MRPWWIRALGLSALILVPWVLIAVAGYAVSRMPGLAIPALMALAMLAFLAFFARQVNRS